MKITKPNLPCFVCGAPDIVYNEKDMCRECQVTSAKYVDFVKRANHSWDGNSLSLGASGGKMKRCWL